MFRAGRSRIGSLRAQSFDLRPSARCWSSKPVLIAATGGTGRHSLVLDHASRPLFSYLRAVVVPTSVYVASEDWGGARGLAERIERAAGELLVLMAGITGTWPVIETAVDDAPVEVGGFAMVPYEQQLAAPGPAD